MKRTLVAALAVSATLVVMGLSNTSADTGGNGIEPRDDGSYEICGQYICYTFFEDVFYGYAINTTKGGQTVQYQVFEMVDFGSFPVQKPPYAGDKTYTVEGSTAISRAYDIPMGVMSFETFVNNTANFDITDSMGVILSSKAAIIGVDEFRGDLVLMGSGSLARTDQGLSVPMQPGDRYYFRAAYMYEESLGTEIANGMIAGEMYLELDDQTLTSSVIDYQPIDMQVEFSSEEKVEISADAAFTEGKTVILTLDDSALDVPLSQLEVKLDGQTLKSVGNVEDVISADEETFYALQNDDSTQLFINIPHFSQRTITISKIGPEEIGMDFYLGAMASVLLVVAAAVYLFRRED